MSTYRDEDIKALKDDLITALTSITPGAGVGVGGVATKAYKVVITDTTLVLNNVLSFCVVSSGTAAGYFTHDPADAAPNRQVIAVDDNLPFGGPINYFSYVKFSAASLATTLTITYILRA